MVLLGYYLLWKYQRNAWNYLSKLIKAWLVTCLWSVLQMLLVSCMRMSIGCPRPFSMCSGVYENRPLGAPDHSLCAVVCTRTDHWVPLTILYMQWYAENRPLGAPDYSLRAVLCIRTDHWVPPTIPYIQWCSLEQIIGCPRPFSTCSDVLRTDHCVPPAILYVQWCAENRPLGAHSLRAVFYYPSMYTCRKNSCHHDYNSGAQLYSYLAYSWISVKVDERCSSAPTTTRLLLVSRSTEYAFVWEREFTGVHAM